MKLSVISFTENGIRLSMQLRESLSEYEVKLYTKCSAGRDKESAAGRTVRYVKERVGEWTKVQMQEKSALIFIGACAIAVRAIAPCLTDKLHDIPVLVLDEQGQWVIPILSGHVGGANELAVFLAERVQAVPVITTATDINQCFAVDLFAKRNQLSIENKDGIAKVSAKILSGGVITMSVESGHIRENEIPPPNVQLVSYPPEGAVDVLVISENGSDVGVFGENGAHSAPQIFSPVNKPAAALLLRPKEYAVGMGCKKGKAAEQIEAFIRQGIAELGIAEQQIFALASIEQKRGEAGLISWAKERGIPFLTYSAKELLTVEGTFHESDFVKDTVGVANVCERAAVCACAGTGRLVYEKHARDGMTLAIAKRDWRVTFDEV